MRVLLIFAQLFLCWVVARLVIFFAARVGYDMPPGDRLITRLILVATLFIGIHAFNAQGIGAVNLRKPPSTGK